MIVLWRKIDRNDCLTLTKWSENNILCWIKKNYLQICVFHRISYLIEKIQRRKNLQPLISLWLWHRVLVIHWRQYDFRYLMFRCCCDTLIRSAIVCWALIGSSRIGFEIIKVFELINMICGFQRTLFSRQLIRFEWLVK